MFNITVIVIPCTLFYQTIFIAFIYIYIHRNYVLLKYTHLFTTASVCTIKYMCDVCFCTVICILKDTASSAHYDAYESKQTVYWFGR